MTSPPVRYRMRLVSLQSGSHGNCIFVEAGSVRLLFDAGLNKKQTQLRLEQIGVDIGSIDAVLITHDHCDHVGYAGHLQKSFGLPVWMTEATYVRAKPRTKHLLPPMYFKAGETINAFEGIRIETWPTPHDAADGVCFVVDDGQNRLGIMTDLGHIPVSKKQSIEKQRTFTGLEDNVTDRNYAPDYFESIVQTLDGVLLESNFDPELLKQNYPYTLQCRIRGVPANNPNGDERLPSGHLSNEESAMLLLKAGKKLKWACLAHLSEQNNTPELAQKTHEEILRGAIPIHITNRNGISTPLFL